MLTTDFITAGKAIFTLSIPSSFIDAMRVKHPDAEPPQPWYTYRVCRKPASDHWPEAHFVNLLTGPDNTSDYTPLGKLNPRTGEISTVRSCPYSEDAWPLRLIRRVCAALWAGDESAAKIAAAGFELRHEGKCGGCGRLLTTPESIDRGIGPECWEKMGG